MFYENKLNTSKKKQIDWSDTDIKSLYELNEWSMGQYHQPYVAKRKCGSSYSLAPVGAVHFHQQYSARRLIGSLWAESKVITLTEWFN